MLGPGRRDFHDIWTSNKSGIARDVISDVTKASTALSVLTYLPPRRNGCMIQGYL